MSTQPIVRHVRVVVHVEVHCHVQLPDIIVLLADRSRQVPQFLRLHKSHHLHWRRQLLWGTGARAPSTSNGLMFLVTSQPNKVLTLDSLCLPTQKEYTGL